MSIVWGCQIGKKELRIKQSKCKRSRASHTIPRYTPWYGVYHVVVGVVVVAVVGVGVVGVVGVVVVGIYNTLYTLTTLYP